MKHRFHPLLSLSLLLLFTACGPKAAALKPASPDSYFPITIGSTSVELQLALTEAEQQRGLMNRDQLGENQGMLFLFQKIGARSFWMRNTRIPLDIGYFDASGQLLEIHALYPYDESPVPSRSQQILIAVETNRGWYAKHNILPGAQLDLDALSEAVKRRREAPETFNLPTR